MPAQEFSAAEVDAAWTAVHGLDAAGATRLQKATVSTQPELLAFTLAFTEDLREEARSLAVFVMHCVIEAFRRNAGSTRRVSQRALLAQWPRSAKRVAGMSAELAEGGSPEAFLASSVQRHVIDAVMDSLEEVEEEGDAPLPADEFWHLMAVLDTAIVALHTSSKPRRAV